MIGWLSAGLGVLLLGSGRRSVTRSDRTSARPGMHRGGGAGPRRVAGGDPVAGPGHRLELTAGTAAVGLCWALLGTPGLLIAPLAAPALVLTVRRAAVLTWRPAGPDPRQVALLIDLLAGALEVGLPIDGALVAVADAVCGQATGTIAFAGPVEAAPRSPSGSDLTDAAWPLGELGRLLGLGAEPEAAWSRLAAVPNFAAVAAAGQRCAHSGARLAQALRSAAEGLRDQRHAESVARADRCGVWVLLPLGLCFLPAFVCLGIVPTIFGVAGGTEMVGVGLP